MTSAKDAAAILREVIEGRRQLRALDPRRHWVQVAVGEVGYDAGGCELVFYADSASLDHLASLAPAGGERTGFSQWLMRDGVNPLDLLDESERLELEQLLVEKG